MFCYTPPVFYTAPKQPQRNSLNARLASANNRASFGGIGSLSPLGLRDKPAHARKLSFFIPTNTTSTAAATTSTLGFSSSFSPPRDGEDLADDNVRVGQQQHQHQLIAKRYAAKAAAAAAVDEAAKNSTTTTTTTAAADTKKSDSTTTTANQNNTVNNTNSAADATNSSNSNNNGLVFRKLTEDEVLQQANNVAEVSTLTSLLNPGQANARRQAANILNTAAAATPVGVKMLNVRVFLHDKTGKKFQANLRLSEVSTGEDLINAAVDQISQSASAKLLCTHPNAYLLRVAESDGTPDEDLPALDKKISFAKFGFNVFALVPNPAYKPSTDQQQQQRQQQQQQQQLAQSKKDDVRMIEDVRLNVYFPRSEHVRLMPVAPDMLVKELLKVVCQRYNLDPTKHTIKILKSVKNYQDFPANMMDRTMRTLNIENIVVIRTAPDDPPQQINHDEADSRQTGGSGSGATGSSSGNTTPGSATGSGGIGGSSTDPNSFFFTIETAKAYKEYLVIKINKYGLRQERRLGIDGEKIYNMMPKGTSSLFGLQPKTKHPERNMDQLDNVQIDTIKPSCFTMTFTDGETLNFEAPSQPIAAEIYAKLKFLLTSRKATAAAILDGSPTMSELSGFDSLRRRRQSRSRMSMKLTLAELTSTTHNTNQ